MKLAMASILSFLLLAWPALAVKLSQDEPIAMKRFAMKRIYYYRDAAGLSNVRLQFEVLVATAAAFGRILVIPPPSKIAHLPEPFQETDVWSENDLSKVTLWEYAKNDQAGANWCPSGAFQLYGKGLETIQPHELPEGQDWCFGEFESRIRNFECLRMFSPGQQKLATMAVFNGLQIKQRWQRKAREVLGKLGLKPGHYMAAHLRRGDFKAMGLGFGNLDKAIPTLNQYGQGKDVLILTDETDPASFKRMKSSVTAATSLSFSSSVLGDVRLKLEGAVVDMLLGAMAGTFVGTPASTFSLSIQQIRTKMDICKKAPQKRQALAFLSKGEQVSRFRVTRWFNSGQLLTHQQDADRIACGYNIGDYSKVTQYKDFDFAKEAACQLEDVQ